jgi:hypothetical protein
MRGSAALMVFKRMAWLVNMRRLADAGAVHVHEHDRVVCYPS